MGTVKYFDNLGNELTTVVVGNSSNKTYFNWNSHLKPSTISPDLYYDDNANNQSDFYNSIVDRSKVLQRAYMSKGITNEDSTIFIQGVLVAFDLADNTPITNNMTWHFKHKADNQYVDIYIDGSNDYNSTTVGLQQVSTFQPSTSDFDYFEFNLVGCAMVDTDGNFLGTFYGIFARATRGGTYVGRCQLIGKGTSYFYAPTVGGYNDVVWSGTLIGAYVPKKREQDATKDTTGGTGGYGTGEMPHDDIDIPIPPLINFWGTGSTLYNLTQGQMASFTEWLWSTDWTKNLRKLRTDPMENIINIALCDFDCGSGTLNANVFVGNITSSTTGTLLNSNFVQLDCGTISLEEYYGSFADYAPYIITTLYLPKVGFVQIPADEIMNNQIHVVYNIELSTGEGICYVQIINQRDGFKYIWNAYTCRCTASIPLSESNNTQMLIATGNAIINTASQAMGSIMNPVSAPQAIGSVASSCLDVATSKNPTITRGSFGNFGSMLCYKRPYLMIQRTNLTKPSSFQSNNGYMVNYTATVGNHTGFLKTNNYHAEFNAPSNFKAEIERLMNEGVFING